MKYLVSKRKSLERRSSAEGLTDAIAESIWLGLRTRTIALRMKRRGVSLAWSWQTFRFTTGLALECC